MAFEECGDYPAIEKVPWSGGKLLVWVYWVTAIARSQ
jgi:hypothetical protein